MSAQPFPIVLGPQSVPVGIGPPNLYYVAFQNPAELPAYVPPLDFRTVVGVTFRVTRERDRSSAVWSTAALSSVTADGLVAAYAFQPGDALVLGRYRVGPWLSVSGYPNAIPCDELWLTVTE